MIFSKDIFLRLKFKCATKNKMEFKLMMKIIKIIGYGCSQILATILKEKI